MQLDKFQRAEFTQHYAGSYLFHKNKQLCYVIEDGGNGNAYVKMCDGDMKGQTLNVHIDDLSLAAPKSGFFTSNNTLRAFSRLPLTQTKRGIDENNTSCWNVKLVEGEIQYSPERMTQDNILELIAFRNNQKKVSWGANKPLFTAQIPGIALTEHYGLMWYVNKRIDKHRLAFVGLGGPIGVIDYRLKERPILQINKANLFLSESIHEAFRKNFKEEATINVG